jgi:hypothetical protein
MNIDELKSTPKERKQLHKQYEETVSDSYTDGAMRLGQLKLLEWLDKQWLLRCDYRIQDGNRKCYRKTCRRCELESKLKEGR